MQLTENVQNLNMKSRRITWFRLPNTSFGEKANRVLRVARTSDARGEQLVLPGLHWRNPQLYFYAWYAEDAIQEVLLGNRS